MAKHSGLVLALAVAGVLAPPAAALEMQAPDGTPLPFGSPVPEMTARVPGAGAYKEIKWDDLIPPGWDIGSVIAELKLDELSDNDPRAAKAMRKIMSLMNDAPSNDEMDGKAIRLPGFVSVIEGDEKSVTEFLLVPYFGACIHVPPPPTNQIVHVLPARPVPAGMTMYPVWVSGVIRVERLDTKLANTGYRIQAATVEPYDN